MRICQAANTKTFEEKTLETRVAFSAHENVAKGQERKERSKTSD